MASGEGCGGRRAGLGADGDTAEGSGTVEGLDTHYMDSGVR